MKNLMNNYNKYLKLVRIILIGLAILFILFFLCKDLALFGNLKFETDFKKFTPFISILVPKERVKVGNFVYMEQEPVYFDVYLPRDFNKAILGFEYWNEFNNLIEIGSQVEETGLELKPLENKIINNLNWPSIKQNDLILYQKKEKFKTIDEFLYDLPPINEIAVYNYDLNYDYKIDDYKSSQEILKLDKKINGYYKFYTYLKSEDLYFIFDLISDSSEINSENVYLNIYDWQNQNIATFYPQNNKITAEIKDLAEGVYKLEIVTADDVITRSIETKQKYLTFINDLNLIDSASLITESGNLVFITFSNQGLQKIIIDDEELNITNIWQQYKKDTASGFKEIKVPQGNISINSEGLFAFASAQYFNPLVHEINRNSDLEKEKINYLITDYNLPLFKDDFKMNTIEFDLSNKQIENGKLRFAISIPGLSEGGKGILIKNLKIKLIRDPLFKQGLFKNLTDYLIYFKNEF